MLEHSLLFQNHFCYIKIACSNRDLVGTATALIISLEMVYNGKKLHTNSRIPS